MKKLFLLISLIGSMSFILTACGMSNTSSNIESHTLIELERYEDNTRDGGKYRTYIFEDTETGVNYIVFRSRWGDEIGTFVPRLNADGSIYTSE